MYIHDGALDFGTLTKIIHTLSVEKGEVQNNTILSLENTEYPSENRSYFRRLLKLIHVSSTQAKVQHTQVAKYVVHTYIQIAGYLSAAPKIPAKSVAHFEYTTCGWAH